MVDHRITDVVNGAHLRLKGILPEQRWCLLLTGSWAAGEGNPMSDIDLELIWIPSPQNAGILERRAIQAAREDIERMSAGVVDFGDVTLHDLPRSGGLGGCRGFCPPAYSSVGWIFARNSPSHPSTSIVGALPIEPRR